MRSVEEYICCTSATKSVWVALNLPSQSPEITKDVELDALKQTWRNVQNNYSESRQNNCGLGKFRCNTKDFGEGEVLMSHSSVQKVQKPFGQQNLRSIHRGLRASLHKMQIIWTSIYLWNRKVDSRNCLHTSLRQTVFRQKLGSSILVMYMCIYICTYIYMYIYIHISWSEYHAWCMTFSQNGSRHHRKADRI